MTSLHAIACAALLCCAASVVIQLPSFSSLKLYYPGYRHHGGRYGNRKFIAITGVRSEYLLHDTSALRLSYTLNKIGDIHSIGQTPISLSVNGKDSLRGRDGEQLIFHPISYGPYLADKYGYPNVSRVQTTDPLLVKVKFWGMQGVIRVLTYTKVGNHPAGHVALWDCDHFHETKDWMQGHSLLTVEFWATPDSDCSSMKSSQEELSKYMMKLNTPLSQFGKWNKDTKLQTKHSDSDSIRKPNTEATEWNNRKLYGNYDTVKTKSKQNYKTINEPKTHNNEINYQNRNTKEVNRYRAADKFLFDFGDSTMRRKYKHLSNRDKTNNFKNPVVYRTLSPYLRDYTQTKSPFGTGIKTKRKFRKW